MRYKHQECDSADEADELADTGSSKKPKGKPKKRKCKKAKVQNPSKTDGSISSKGKAKHPTDGSCNYQPGSFRQERLDFIHKTMEEKSIKFFEAAKYWLPSARRAALLDGLSRSELQRRRFVPAMNPRSKKTPKTGPKPA